MVIVPATESMGPVFSSWTGPTKLRSTDDGDGPKYERSTVAPTEGGAGNTSHPGPAPLGPGPGPWAALGFVADALAMFAWLMSIFPSTALRGVRSRGESCASAVMPKVTAIAEARATRGNLRLLEALQFNGDSPHLVVGLASFCAMCAENVRPRTSFARSAGKLRGHA